MAKFRVIEGGLPETPQAEYSFDEATFMQRSIQPLTPEAFHNQGYRVTEGYDRAQAEKIVPINAAFTKRNQNPEGGTA
jgi:hypothetical protein